MKILTYPGGNVYYEKDEESFYHMGKGPWGVSVERFTGTPVCETHITLTKDITYNPRIFRTVEEALKFIKKELTNENEQN